MKDQEARNKIEKLSGKHAGLKELVEDLVKKEGYDLHSWFMQDNFSVYDNEETNKRKHAYKKLTKKIDALAEALGYEFETVEAQPSKIIAVVKSEDKKDHD